jgi:hypothetical protein
VSLGAILVDFKIHFMVPFAVSFAQYNKEYIFYECFGVRNFYYIPEKYNNFLISYVQLSVFA